jgi:serine/threonine-protein kinase
MSAFCSESIAYAADVPAELGTIANRAMAREPSERHASALELRRAIAEFLRHKSSIALADEASERLVLLGTLLMHAPEDEPPRELERAYQLVTEARFGLVQSLREWPENPRALRALALCLEATAELELRQGHLATAETLMREITAPSQRLSEMYRRCKRRRQRQAFEQERLQALARDLDVRVAGKQRSRGLAAVAGAAFAVSAFAISQPNPSRLRPEALLAFAVIVVLAMAGVIFALRRALLGNVFNRRLVGFAMVAALSVLASRGIATWIGMRAPAVLAQDLFVLAAVAASSSVILPWVALLVPLFLGGSVVCLAWPELSVFAFAAAVIVSPPLVAHALWRHHESEKRQRMDAIPDSLEIGSSRR